MAKKEVLINKKNRIKECKADKIFDVVNAIVLSIILIVVAYPLIIVVSSSISSPNALMSGKVWLYPIDICFDGYTVVAKNKEVLNGIKNSIIYTVGGTAINMLMSVLAAYPLSRSDFKARNFINLMFAFTMWFSGGIIPSYILVKDLGMYNTIWAMLIPGAMSVWNMILIRTYFQSNIPESLFESAKLDGCNDFKYLWYIALPISLPVLAVVTLYYTVSHWNNFFNAYLYLQSVELKPLQVVLRDILLLSQTEDLMMAEDATSMAKTQSLNEVLKYSLVVVSSFPMALLYVVTQKYFTKGIMVGSVKG